MVTPSEKVPVAETQAEKEVMGGTHAQAALANESRFVYFMHFTLFGSSTLLFFLLVCVCVCVCACFVCLLFDICFVVSFPFRVQARRLFRRFVSSRFVSLSICGLFWLFRTFGALFCFLSIVCVCVCVCVFAFCTLLSGTCFVFSFRLVFKTRVSSFRFVLSFRVSFRTCALF